MFFYVTNFCAAMNSCQSSLFLCKLLPPLWESKCKSKFLSCRSVLHHHHQQCDKCCWPRLPMSLCRRRLSDGSCKRNLQQWAVENRCKHFTAIAFIYINWISRQMGSVISLTVRKNKPVKRSTIRNLLSEAGFLFFLFILLSPHTWES